MSGLQLKGARRNGRRRPGRGSRVVPGPRRMVSEGLRNGKLGAALLLAFGLWGIFYILTSPGFVVQSVTVINSQLQLPEQVVQLAEVRGRPIWLIDPEEVVTNLRRSSYIESATVTLALPNHVTIIVGERQPAIRWSAGGTPFLVDKSGLVLGPAEPSGEDALVVIDTSHAVLQQGDQLDPDALELARVLWIRLPQELNLKPKRIEWDIGYGISVITESDQQIAFGRKDDKKVPLDVKIATLQQLIADGTPFQFLDLRPALPYYR
ncbi:MAG: cell division protein FtsQ [Herpetosiphonaceae bacterium]|nr:MAG: cell division protein FtsQ [Herpetosiphonaceae bacterium]